MNCWRAYGECLFKTALFCGSPNHCQSIKTKCKRSKRCVLGARIWRQDKRVTSWTVQGRFILSGMNLRIWVIHAPTVHRHLDLFIFIYIQYLKDQEGAPLEPTPCQIILLLFKCAFSVRTVTEQGGGLSPLLLKKIWDNHTNHPWMQLNHLFYKLMALIYIMITKSFEKL
jgi:hypothetical protein